MKRLLLFPHSVSLIHNKATIEQKENNSDIILLKSGIINTTQTVCHSHASTDSFLLFKKR